MADTSSDRRTSSSVSRTAAAPKLSCDCPIRRAPTITDETIGLAGSQASVI